MKYKMQSSYHGSSTSLRDWLVLGVAAVGVFFCGWGVERLLERVVATQIEIVIEKINHRLGIPVVIGQREINKTSLLLTDIAIGEGQLAVIDKIEIGLGLNPFSPSFLRPSRIEIGRVFFKEQVRRDERMKWLKRWRDLFAAGKESTSAQLPKPTLLPPELHIAAGKIVLADGKDIHTVISGISATVLLSQKRIYYEIDQAIVAPWLEEGELSGRAFSLENGDIQWAVRRRPKLMEKSEWLASCEKRKNSREVVCDIDAEHLPNSVVRPFAKMLGSAPGFHGSIHVTPLQNGLLAVAVDADVTGITATHSTLSVDQIGPFSVGSKFAVTIDPKSKRIFGNDLRFAFAPDITNERSVGVTVDLDLTKMPREGENPGRFVGDVHFVLPRTRCDDVLNAVPPGFAPDVQGFALAGDISLEAVVKLNNGDIDFRWGKTLLACNVVNVPQSYTNEYLSGAFELERVLQDGRTIRIPVDPAGPNYARLRDIPAPVVSAFVTSEDAGFWQHNGVEPSAIIQALERNAREGRVAVGGSTITMQTVKNLFLSRDKNISRKAQEIFLAWYLDQALGKQRILEIYLNIVEFGPDLYGLGAASRKFFGVPPSQLTLKQGIYLASLLPAPIPRFQYYCRGSLTPNYAKLVDVLLHRMLSLGRISSEAYAAASAAPILFQSDRDDVHCKSRAASTTDGVNSDAELETEE